MDHEAAGNAPRGEGDREYGIAPPGRALPPSARLGPVRLQVADLGRSVDFYNRVLGLVPLEAGPAGEHATREAGAVLGAGGKGEPLVELVERPGAVPVPRRGRLGLYHFALLVPDRSALAKIARHLKDLDLPVGMADHRVSEALYLMDPDGIGIEVYRDRPRERWESKGRQLVITTEPPDLEGLMAEVEAPAGPEKGSSAAGVPPGTIVGHVHFHVGDLEPAARFYHRGLGFDKIAWDYPGALFLSAGGYHHHVGLNTWARGAGPAGAGDARLLSWTLVLPDEGAVERVRSQVEAAGFEGMGGRAGASSDAVVLEDPWGTAVEIVAEAGGSA